MFAFYLFFISLVFAVNFINCSAETGGSENVPQNSRNKRLLFYDEEGNLVKTFTNQFLRDIYPRPETYPFFGNFLKPYPNFLLPQNSGRFTPYMIPIAEDVIHQVNQDPIYQNKLLFIAPKEPSIEPSPLCNGKRTQVPSPNSCSNFLNCWDGWAFEQECPEGLMFSELGYCDYAYRVDCGSRRLMDDLGALAPQCSKDFEAFRNEAKCGEFFVCVNHLPVRFVCPADLYFNEKLGICDYPHRVECGVSLSVKPPAPSNEMAPPNSEPQTNMATSQAPSTKIMYGENIISKLVPSSIVMSREEAIRKLNLRQKLTHFH